MAKNETDSEQTDYEAFLCEQLQDPAFVAEYLSSVLRDEEPGSDKVFLVALRNVAEVYGMSKLALETGLNRENLYRMLSAEGNPTWSSVMKLLRSLGLNFSTRMAGHADEECPQAASESRVPQFDLPNVLTEYADLFSASEPMTSQNKWATVTTGESTNCVILSEFSKEQFEYRA